MAVGCRIKKNIVRPDRSLVEAFRGIPVANIDDCMNRLSAVQAELCPMNSSPLLGTAFTVKCPAGDNLMFHKALDLAQPGDVLVIAAGGSMSRALCGDSILVIKPEDAEKLAKAAKAVQVKEGGQLAGIKTGKGFPCPFVDQILEQIGVEYVD